MFGQKKLIVYELNEVPLRVFQWFATAYPQSTIARLMRDGELIETKTGDEGHLSPWVTWPTLHRGVPNTEHHISDFGQDLREVNASYPSVWELLSRAGRTVGLFGSLHSHPLPANVDDYSFYVPDTFAAGPECFPERLEAFQRFNLSMVDRSGRNVSSGLPLREAASFLAAAPGLGLRGATAGKIAMQLAQERVKPERTVRRRTTQVQVAFDFFLKELRRTTPEFATFFTNHVASSLHRYWPGLFPGDYKESKWDQAWMKTWSGEIPFAMREADAALAELKAFVDRDSRYALVVVTSMGQAAEERQEIVETELVISDLTRFVRLLGFADEDWRRERAMAPQYIVHVRAGLQNEFADRLSRLRVNGNAIEYSLLGDTVFRINFGIINLATSSIRVEMDGRAVPLAEAGMTNMRIQDEAGANAYHIPEGCMIVYGAGKKRPSGPISTLQIAPAILDNFGIAPPRHMTHAG